MSIIQYTIGCSLLYNYQPKSRRALLPASRLWANTGLKVKKGDCLLIKATGRIHLAGHRLFQGAVQDTLPPYPWIDADGKSEVQAFQKRSQETKRSFNLIDPDSVPGVLLAYLATEKKDEPDFMNPRGKDKGRLHKIGSSWHLKAPSEGTFTLYLSVNDIFLSRRDFEMYKKTTDKEKGIVGTAAQRWEVIESNNYWNIWFDDNLGDFLVNIEYKDKNDNCE
jgi:hypothetical protein